MNENTDYTRLPATISELRSRIKGIAKEVGVLLRNCDLVPGKSDLPEMADNVILSYRHLEDAAMRLGKVIQAYDGGVSCYDGLTVYWDPPTRSLPSPTTATDHVIRNQNVA